MRILKPLIVIVVSLMIVGWFATMAKIGMDNKDEWYEKESDTGIAEQSDGEAPLPACTDDSAPNYPCQWDATTQGDGEGESFWVDEYGNTHTWQVG